MSVMEFLSRSFEQSCEDHQRSIHGTTTLCHQPPPPQHTPSPKWCGLLGSRARQAVVGWRGSASQYSRRIEVMNEGRLPPELAKLSTTALSLTRELWGQAVPGRDLRMTLAESSSSSPGGWSIATIIFISSSASWFQGLCCPVGCSSPSGHEYPCDSSGAPVNSPAQCTWTSAPPWALGWALPAAGRSGADTLGGCWPPTSAGTLRGRAACRAHPWKASPVWVWLCLSRLAWVQRVLPQRWPWKAFLPMCIRRCRLRSASQVKLWLQNSHTDGLSFLCRLSLFQAGAPIPCTRTASPQGAQKPPAAATPLGHEALGAGVGGGTDVGLGSSVKLDLGTLQGPLRKLLGAGGTLVGRLSSPCGMPGATTAPSSSRRSPGTPSTWRPAPSPSCNFVVYAPRVSPSENNTLHIGGTGRDSPQCVSCCGLLDYIC